MSITTRNSAGRLAGLIAHARAFADEVIVNVDQSSTDATLGVALAHADVVCPFHHTGEKGQADTLAFAQTRCDWVLILDDDEAVDTAFAELLPELIGAPHYTHWWFPRHWLVSSNPLVAYDTPPWHPDWQLRLIKADPQLIWKPRGVHQHMRVAGRGGRESRTAILHYERILLSPEARAEKIERYRARGSRPESEAVYAPEPDAPQRPVAVGPQLPAPLDAECAPPRAIPARLEPMVNLDTFSPLPPWDADLTVHDLPAVQTPGATVTVRVDAVNTSGLHWPTHNNSPGEWPVINLVCRALDADGQPIDATAQRFAIPRGTPVGGTAHFLCSVELPASAGIHELQWELVSETEVWFSRCGTQPVHTRIELEERAADRQRDEPTDSIAA